MRSEAPSFAISTETEYPINPLNFYVPHLTRPEIMRKAITIIDHRILTNRNMYELLAETVETLTFEDRVNERNRFGLNEYPLIRTEIKSKINPFSNLENSKLPYQTMKVMFGLTRTPSTNFGKRFECAFAQVTTLVAGKEDTYRHSYIRDINGNLATKRQYIFKKDGKIYIREEDPKNNIILLERLNICGFVTQALERGPVPVIEL